MKKYIDVKLQVLPPQQQVVWKECRYIPDNFVLYGGTAIALQLGHRVSVDFDFFTTKDFAPRDLERSVPLLSFTKEVYQAKANNYTVNLELEQGPVQISFFGGLKLGRLGEIGFAKETEVKVASLLDLLAHKLKVIHERSELKDYQDIIALLKSGLRLEEGLGGMQALFPNSVNPSIALKALTYFKDGNLDKLTKEEKIFLEEKVRAVKTIPTIELVGSELSN